MNKIKLSEIHPAEYNPRLLTESAFIELQGSLKMLGFILPIIVNEENMTIVAGHQRTKAAKAIGIDEVPCFFVNGIDITSEIYFNQIHNGVEAEPEQNGKCKQERPAGSFYLDVPNTDFEIEDSNPHYVKNTCDMIQRYGDALCAIVCGDEVLFGNNYVRSAQLLDIPVHCYYLEEEKRALFDYYFKQDYGVFNYEHINKNDFVQGLAQLNRGVRSGIKDWSVLYSRIVNCLAKETDKNIKILDFACGKGECIEKVRKNLSFRNAIGLEFFHNNKKGISIERGQENVDKFIAAVQKYGFENDGVFDYVICDSVMNSTNSLEAEESILRCLSLFCKMGGKIFLCGRTRYGVEKTLTSKKSSGSVRNHYFLDDSGYTAILREGQWYFQRFHTKEQVEAMFEKYGFEPFMRYGGDGNGMWGFGATKVRQLSEKEYADAIRFEFNLKLPGGRRYNRHEEVLQLFGLSHVE